MKTKTLFPEVRRLETQEQLAELAEAANADDHIILGATHVVRRDEEIVGYIGVGGIPLVTFWGHSQKLKPRDSAHLIAMGETLAHSSGWPRCLTMVARRSPFHPVMPTFGFRKLETDLFLKELCHGMR